MDRMVRLAPGHCFEGGGGIAEDVMEVVAF